LIDTLRVTGLTRERLGTEEFDRPSDGTNEQVAGSRDWPSRRCWSLRGSADIGLS
jgi:hypothetical protein